MKGFFKTLLAVILGIMLCSILSIFILSAIVGSFAISTNVKAQMPNEGVLSIDMSKIELAEQTTPLIPNPADLLNSSSAERIPVIGILDAVRAINAAADDPGVKFIFLRPEGITASSISEVEELRTALSNFRSSGKPIIAGMENPDNSGYYLGSVADKVYLCSNTGSILMNGISGRLVHYKDLLDALGINIQLIRCGKYKSAGERYITNKPSQENLEQTKAMVSSLWGTISSAISQSRDISVDDFNDAIDNLRLQSAQDFIDANLADELLSKDMLEQRLTALAMKNKFSQVGFIDFADYAKAKSTTNFKASKKLAIVYVDGQIVDGSDIENVAGKRFAGIISDVREDSTIKAVVLRVNSPGGSVSASEQIRAEMDRLCAVKPVVASYGGYAASGGYWISNNCEKIFSDATTLTGSIGVFSAIPDFSKTLKDKLKIGVYTVNSNKHSDMFQGIRPFDKDEYAYMQKENDSIYERFISIVADGRDLETDYVRTIAEGRVWTGSDALGIGLVDEIGTLEDAVKWAAIAGSSDASQAELSNWDIVPYPKPMTMFDYIMLMMGDQQAQINPLAGTEFEDIGASLLKWASKVESGKKTQNVFALMPYIDIR